LIVPDTSVWVAALRNPGASQAYTLGQLLDADEVALALPVRIELMAGARVGDRRSLTRGLSALPIIYPTDETWTLIGQWVLRAADAGFHFGVTDLLIAALAHDIDALVWTLDKDFMAMETLDIARLYAPAVES
jgi:predicted nucleic acid-binding protein